MSFIADSLVSFCDPRVCNRPDRRLNVLMCKTRAADNREKNRVSKPNLVERWSGWQAGQVRQRPSAGYRARRSMTGSNGRRVERLIDALRLSRASGVAIENLAGDEVEKLAAPFIHHAPSAGRSVFHPTNLASFQGRIST